MPGLHAESSGDEWKDPLDELWDSVEADEKERRRQAYLRQQAEFARQQQAALELSIRAMAGELMAELTVNGRCTAGALAMELAKLVPPLPRTEYRLAVDTQALQPSDRLRDVVSDGAELTALLVESMAGEFFCQVNRTSGVTLCLGTDRRARCQIERNIGGIVFNYHAEGEWEEALEESRLHLTLDQGVGAMSEFVIRRTLEMARTGDGDLELALLAVWKSLFRRLCM
ncbi:unnamed protein product [Effrenium voratum]|nr:unnamed protein product [Effrenium voratum]